MNFKYAGLETHTEIYTTTTSNDRQKNPFDELFKNLIQLDDRIMH